MEPFSPMWTLIILPISFTNTASSNDLRLHEFGNCHFHIKILTQNPKETVYHDIAAKVISVNKNMGPWTFHDSTNETSMTIPSLDILGASCTLHILLGLAKRNSIELFLLRNPYDKMPSMHSTVLLISTGQLKEIVFRKSAMYIQSRVFAKMIFSLRGNGRTGYLFYYCPYCPKKIEILESTECYRSKYNVF